MGTIIAVFWTAVRLLRMGWNLTGHFSRTVFIGDLLGLGVLTWLWILWAEAKGINPGIIALGIVNIIAVAAVVFLLFVAVRHERRQAASTAGSGSV